MRLRPAGLQASAAEDVGTVDIIAPDYPDCCLSFDPTILITYPGFGHPSLEYLDFCRRFADREPARWRTSISASSCNSHHEARRISS